MPLPPLARVRQEVLRSFAAAQARVTRGTGYGHRTARLGVRVGSAVEDVRMTRPVTIPGPTRQMGRAASLLPLPTACPALRLAKLSWLHPESAELAIAPSNRYRTTLPERRPLPSLPQRRTAHPVCSRTANTLGVARLGAGREPVLWDI